MAVKNKLKENRAPHGFNGANEDGHPSEAISIKNILKMEELLCCYSDFFHLFFKTLSGKDNQESINKALM